jgi:hypothetical protein
VIEFLHRWIFVDFWVPVWPNLAAAALCALHITNSNKKHSTRPTRRILGWHVYLGSKEGADDEDG